jgi:hypothetical protein
MKKKNKPTSETTLLNEITVLIEQSKMLVVAQVNSTLTLLFWRVGKRINEFVLEHKRAEYGKQIVVTLSRQLEERYGRNFEEKNLRRMLQFADIFIDPEKVVTLSRHLTWSHFLALLPLKSEEQRLFYTQRTIQEQLSVRDLRKQIEKKA